MTADEHGVAPEVCDDYPFLRLVKLSSDVLPSHKTVAIVDGRHGGVSIGRDKAFTPRLRLPSMEVSKHHANLFSTSRAPIRFSIADTGSMHGTYVRRRASTSYERLSPPKHASRPWTLEHLDVVRIGVQSTEFEVHLHDKEACDRCAVGLDGQNELSLAPTATKAARRPAAEPVVGDGRKQLKALKSMYVPRTVPQTSTAYRDRAAVRRRLYPPEPAPPAPPTTTTTTTVEPDIGRRMLQHMAQGADVPLLRQAPIVPRVTQGRAGLGSGRMVDADTYGRTK